MQPLAKYTDQLSRYIGVIYLHDDRLRTLVLANTPERLESGDEAKTAWEFLALTSSRGRCGCLNR